MKSKLEYVPYGSKAQFVLDKWSLKDWSSNHKLETATSLLVLNPSA